MKDHEIEELLKIAESGDDVAPANEAERFVVDMGIREGNGSWRIYPVMVYMHYRDWAKAKGLVPIPRRDFMSQFNGIFKHTYKRLGYALDPTPFDLSPENKFRYYAELRKMRKEDNGKKSKKK